MKKRFSEKILFVDDEPKLLAAINRQLGREYNISTAIGGEQGLELLQNEGPFAIVISDMRMPKMNGIQFLAHATSNSPETVRMMLTGNSDVETAMHAINEGNILRFLVKPCQKETLIWAIEAGIKQYQLVIAEKELLEKTLKGVIQVMTNILSLVSPQAFSRTSRIRDYIKQICQLLNIEGPWKYDLAAMLSQIGCVTLPTDLIAKLDSGSQLSEHEEDIFGKHPHLAETLISKIPRLRVVSEMIANQLKDASELNAISNPLPDDSSVLGSLLLKTALDFDSHLIKGCTHVQACALMYENSSAYNVVLLDALKKIKVVQPNTVTKSISIFNLKDSMVLSESIRTKDYVLIANKEQLVNSSVRTLLANFYERKEIDEFVTVYTQTSEENYKQNSTCAVDQ